jgi:hypothetical protein
VLWRVVGVVESCWCCGELLVLWRVVGVVECGDCGVDIVAWSVEGVGMRGCEGGGECEGSGGRVW